MDQSGIPESKADSTGVESLEAMRGDLFAALAGASEDFLEADEDTARTLWDALGERGLLVVRARGLEAAVAEGEPAEAPLPGVPEALRDDLFGALAEVSHDFDVRDAAIAAALDGALGRRGLGVVRAEDLGNAFPRIRRTR